MGNYQNGYGNKCPICGKEEIDISCDSVKDKYFFYRCPNCGNFFAPDINYDLAIKYPNAYPDFNYDRNHLKCYLFYNNFEKRPFFASQEQFEKLDKTGYKNIYNLTPEMVENWYPKTFTDKVDLILLWIADHSSFMGEKIKIPVQQLHKLFFMKNPIFSENVNEVKFIQELNYIGEFLQKEELIKTFDNISGYSFGKTILFNNGLSLVLLNKGYNKIYDLQKKQQNNKNVFIAMKFGEETKALRAAIKAGIEKAGYIAVILDEVEYNGQIVPEMLYQIKQSRFVVAELSHHNNGAYYEAGYAAGYGKDVIQICSEEALKSDLHFDVKQVNSITYSENNLEELTDRLQKRIKSTIQ